MASTIIFMTEEMGKDYANINATYGVSPETLSKKLAITVDEDVDNFIFTVIRPFCEMKSGYVLSKNDLIEALKMYNERKDRSFVTPKQSWIPVSERLPDKSMDVMACDEFGAIFLAHFNKGYSFDEYTVAWMPLPEPYKEGGSDENALDSSKKSGSV